MFYVPSDIVNSRPGWSKQQLFFTDGKKPLLIAHVIPVQVDIRTAGHWAFAHPSDFEHLLNGIAQNEEPYRITSLCVLLNPSMCIDGISAEEVLDVTTNSCNQERRSFLVRTILGNTYLLGDELVGRTTLDVIIYQRGQSDSVVSGTSH